MDRSTRPALVALATIQAALFLYYMRANIVLEPYWDMYSHLTRYLQFQADGDLFRYLWDPHVQHRHVWMRLLTWLDASVFAGVSYPFIVTAIACQVATAWLLAREARRAAAPPLRTAAACLASMLVLTSVAAVVCALPINSIYPQVVTFGVLAIVLAAGGSPPAYAGAVAAAIAAAYANTVALVLWPILWWMAWQQGKSARWLGAFAAIGVAFAIRHVIGLPLADQASAAPGTLLEKADYLLAYLGLPWTRSISLAIPGRIAGALLLIIAATAIARRATTRGRSRPQQAALALVAFSLASATLAAAGRVPGTGDVAVPVRYTVLLAPLHVGLLLLALEWAGRHERLAGRAAVGAAIALVVQQVGAGQAANGYTAAIRETVGRFNAGETAPGMERVVFDDLPEARRQWQAIQDAGLYRDVR